MGGRSFWAAVTVLALGAGCGPLPLQPVPAAPTVAALAGQQAWTVAPVPALPPVVQAALERDKEAVLREIRQAEGFKSLSVGPGLAVRQWRVDGTVVGYVATLHGAVTFDVPGWHKAGAFIVDFCLDPAGNDFGGTYAFTVRSEHPVSRWRSPQRPVDAAGPLSLVREVKPAAIQAVGERLAFEQRDRLENGLSGLRLSATKVFGSAVAVRYGDTLIGYIDTQTASALPQGDVVGVQVLNYLDPAGRHLFGEARAASANHLDRYRTVRL